MRKFYFKCKEISTNNVKEVFVTAEDYQEAEEKILKDKDKIIPIEYIGWEEIA